MLRNKGTQNKAPKAPKKKQSPQTQQQRSIISYTTSKGQKFYRDKAAKSAKGKGTNNPATFIDVQKDANPVGLTQQTLPDGKIVHIFKQKSHTPHSFVPTVQQRRPKRHVDESTPSKIHQIASEIARVKPIIVAESSLKDSNRQFISNANNFTSQDYNANGKSNHIIRITPPTFMTADLFSRGEAKSLNQFFRHKSIIQKRAGEIRSKQSRFNKSLITMQKQHDSIPQDITSTSEAPISFTNNNTLKFRIIDAVIRATGVQVPSSELSKINDVSELSNWIVAKDAQLKEMPLIEKIPFPENVKMIYVNAVDRKKQPNWEKYKTARENNEVVSL